ncbi:MAG: FtsX-like permease family protein [Clostridia bacterium]|nr:FtsX-like permease family protein [Clostridia bacterium]
MSGGQMQRVAIARALVNDPEILLADEPTGALDTDTSVQIMEILKEISKDKLIIMVTHNPELAETYSDRIIRLKDGMVIGDTNPFSSEEEMKEVAEINASEEAEKAAGNVTEIDIKKKKKKKPSMSFLTALSLSFNNLLTKKTRTFLTSFAGSIGIIGIALILSLSNGINAYIGRVQRETLSSYPIVLQKEEVDMTAMLGALMSQSEPIKDKDENKVYTNPVSYTMLNSMLNPHTHVNNLSKFKGFIESNKEIADYTELIRYGYDVDINAYLIDGNNNYYKADMGTLFSTMASEAMGGTASNSSMSSMMSDASMLGDIWSEILPPEEGSNELVHSMIKEQYDLVAGKWPESKNDVILVISSDNTISDLSLYSLGLATTDEMIKAVVDAMNGIEADVNSMESYAFDQLVYNGEGDTEFINYMVVPTSDFYVNKNGKWVDARTLDDTIQLNSIISGGIELKVTGIVRPNPEATAGSLSGTLVYTSALTDYLMNEIANSDIVKAQQNNTATDIFTGLPFEAQPEVGSAEKFKNYLASASVEQRARIFREILTAKDEDAIKAQVEGYLTGLGVTKVPTDASQHEAYKADLINKIVTQAGQLGQENESMLRAYLSMLDANQLYVQIYNFVRDEIVATYDAEAEKQINAIINEPDQIELDAEIMKATFRMLRETHPGSLKVMYEQMMPGQSSAGMTDEMILTTLNKAMDMYGSGSEFKNLSGATLNGSFAQDEYMMRAYLTYRYKAITAMSDEQISALVGSLTFGGTNTLYYTFMAEIEADAVSNYKTNMAASQSEDKKNAKLAAAFMAAVEGGAYTDVQLKEFYEDNKLVPKSSPSTYDENLSIMGYASKDDPSSISIYARSFEEKELIADIIKQYNEDQTDTNDKISYTDYVGLIMSSVTTIINAITYVLVFFVSISLVVSSIMIGIITYISVLERTKEIGILRAIGASKRDISRVFNAETLIVGFASGMIGIIVTLLLNIPIAIIIKHLSGISGLATLPVVGGIALVIISMLLTFVAGLIPSGIAAKKDPVESLRSE